MTTQEPMGGHTGEEPSLQSKDEQARRLNTDESALSPWPPEYSVEVSLPRSPWLEFHFRSPLKAPPVPPAPPPPRVGGEGAGELEDDRVVPPYQ